MYDFFCIDIIGSSRETDIKNDDIKDLLLVIKDYLSKYAEQIQSVFTGDGVLIWFKKDSLLPVQLALKVHEKFPQINDKSSLGLKIGISRGDAIEIESAKSLVGIPVWGNGPAIAKSLCDLCDEGHILLDSNIYQNIVVKYEKELEDLLASQPFDKFFQDLGEYFVKHKKSLHVFNFCNETFNDNIHLFGNNNFPLDKRGVVDRINIDPELSRPFDTFLEYEGMVLKGKIERADNIILLDQSMSNMYNSLFQHAVGYNSTNTMVPSMFQKYQSKAPLLNYQARLIRRSLKNDTDLKSNINNGVRIMVMEKYNIEKDWDNHNTRDACIDFLNWHKDWGVTLLQIQPHYANEIRRSIEESTYFQFKSMEIGLWNNKYCAQFGEYKYDDINDEARKYNIWISGFNTISYGNCKLLLNTIMTHKEINEINYYDDNHKPDCIKWNHTYWKSKIGQ